MSTPARRPRGTNPRMGRPAKPCPPDLAPLLATLPASEVARRGRVSVPTARAWQRAAGVVPERVGRPRSAMPPADTRCALDALLGALVLDGDADLARLAGIPYGSVSSARIRGLSAERLAAWEKSAREGLNVETATFISESALTCES